jgi:ferritin
MSGNSSSDGNSQETSNFVDQWIDQGRESEDLDSNILDQIDSNRDSTDLNESSLLNSLVEHADKSETEDDDVSS